MLEVLEHMCRWIADGDAGVLSSVVSTSSSAPRLPGAVMAVDPDGHVLGSVSGGCVEGAVYETALEVRRSGRPVLQSFGYSTGEAVAVGLTCGGTIEIWTEVVSEESFPELAAVVDAVRGGRPVAVATVIEHPDPGRVGSRRLVRPSPVPGIEDGSLGSERLDDAVLDDARGMLASGSSGVLTYGPEGERRGVGTRVFVASLATRSRMIVFGAIDFAAAMVKMGAFLGYRVTVCDARPLFATVERFPEADDVVVDWPHRYLSRQLTAGEIDERTVIAVLTHDPKFDVPLLEVALRAPRVGFVGAMGSRRTHEERVERLTQAGLTEQELSRLSSPIGLDLGGRTPEETALSIAAEIVAHRWGGTGEPLARRGGPIHRSDPVETHTGL